MTDREDWGDGATDRDFYVPRLFSTSFFLVVEIAVIFAKTQFKVEGTESMCFLLPPL
jgi:hypothetical protein